ncbi:hypothetical protein ACFHYQ_17155 [Sphaerimonospora cavernae]|uniref:Uncharacterized protein n=1 Tax=Sphaerimonospora cavernae TaxID=1740611 RepID=A0ABV6U8X9_9ACTN
MQRDGTWWMNNAGADPNRAYAEAVGGEVDLLTRRRRAAAVRND